jgi:protein phosphatase
MTNFIETDGFRYAPGNAQHQGCRREQQDSFEFSDPTDRAFMDHGGLLAVLADGMGGMANGAQAGRIAVEVLLEAYTGKDRDEDIPAAMHRALCAADRAVFDFACAVPADEAGTTLVAAVLAARLLF